MKNRRTWSHRGGGGWSSREGLHDVCFDEELNLLSARTKKEDMKIRPWSCVRSVEYFHGGKTWRNINLFGADARSGSTSIGKFRHGEFVFPWRQVYIKKKNNYIYVYHNISEVISSWSRAGTKFKYEGQAALSSAFVDICCHFLDRQEKNRITSNLVFYWSPPLTGCNGSEILRSSFLDIWDKTQTCTARDFRSHRHTAIWFHLNLDTLCEVCFTYTHLLPSA